MMSAAALSSRTTVRALLARDALLLAAASALRCAALVERCAALLACERSASGAGGAILERLSCAHVSTCEQL